MQGRETPYCMSSGTQSLPVGSDSQIRRRGSSGSANFRHRVSIATDPRFHHSYIRTASESLTSLGHGIAYGICAKKRCRGVAVAYVRCSVEKGQTENQVYACVHGNRYPVSIQPMEKPFP